MGKNEQLKAAAALEEVNEAIKALKDQFPQIDLNATLPANTVFKGQSPTQIGEALQDIAMDLHSRYRGEKVPGGSNAAGQVDKILTFSGLNENEREDAQKLLSDRLAPSRPQRGSSPYKGA